MKRSLVATIIIGVVVAGIVCALHASGLILRFERVAIEPISDYAGATRVVSEKWQYVFVPLLALGVAWLTLTSVSRRGMRWLFLVLLIELLGLSWVCSLYRIFFQALPSCFCGALRMARSRGMGRLFQAGPLALVQNLLPWPIVGQRTSSLPRRLNSIRSPTKSARSDRGCLRHCE
jgi:hypothetical protein